MRSATNSMVGPIRAERPRPVLVAPPRETHAVTCRGCLGTFDLFAADWCGCAEPGRSKKCPACGACACTNPGFRDPRMWARAPPAFLRHGFERLFVDYL